MAQSNTQSTNPHSLSLKVLRLSRPSLAAQTSLLNSPPGTSIGFPHQAAFPYPSAEPTSTLPLTPLLTLPASFGAAYIGETFACTLCVNNELSPPDSSGKSITAVRVTADLQTPSYPAGVPLSLTTTAVEEGSEAGIFPPAATLQKTLQHDLKEPGPHVLAVTVSYTETSRGGEAGGAASGGRARTFRKLYQFVAQPVLAVRSKVSPLAAAGAGKGEEKRWLLEAQLENVGEGRVVVDRVLLNEGSGIEWRGGVGRELSGGVCKKTTIVLRPRDVEQVMFVVRDKGTTGASSGARALAQVDIDWTSAMGEKGKLVTGWLSARG